VASDVIKRTARAENRPVDAGGSVSVVGGAGGKLLCETSGAGAARTRRVTYCKRAAWAVTTSRPQAAV